MCTLRLPVSQWNGPPLRGTLLCKLPCELSLHSMADPPCPVYQSLLQCFWSFMLPRTVFCGSGKWPSLLLAIITLCQPLSCKLPLLAGLHTPLGFPSSGSIPVCCHSPLCSATWLALYLNALPSDSWLYDSINLTRILQRLRNTRETWMQYWKAYSGYQWIFWNTAFKEKVMQFATHRKYFAFELTLLLRVFLDTGPLCSDMLAERGLVLL